MADEDEVTEGAGESPPGEEGIPETEDGFLEGDLTNTSPEDDENEPEGEEAEVEEETPEPEETFEEELPGDETTFKKRYGVTVRELATERRARQEAENRLAELEATPGEDTALLTDEAVNVAARQSASKEYWRWEESQKLDLRLQGYNEEDIAERFTEELRTAKYRLLFDEHREKVEGDARRARAKVQIEAPRQYKAAAAEVLDGDDSEAITADEISDTLAEQYSPEIFLGLPAEQRKMLAGVARDLLIAKKWREGKLGTERASKPAPAPAPRTGPGVTPTNGTKVTPVNAQRIAALRGVLGKAAGDLTDAQIMRRYSEYEKERKR